MNKKVSFPIGNFSALSWFFGQNLHQFSWKLELLEQAISRSPSEKSGDVLHFHGVCRPALGDGYASLCKDAHKIYRKIIESTAEQDIVFLKLRNLVRKAMKGPNCVYLGSVYYHSTEINNALVEEFSKHGADITGVFGFIAVCPELIDCCYKAMVPGEYMTVSDLRELFIFISHYYSPNKVSYLKTFSDKLVLLHYGIGLFPIREEDL